LNYYTIFDFFFAKNDATTPPSFFFFNRFLLFCLLQYIFYFGYVRWGLLQFKILCFGELCAKHDGLAIKYKAAGGTWLASQSGCRLSSWSSRHWHVMELKTILPILVKFGTETG
jgi:hypothetical protein